MNLQNIKCLNLIICLIMILPISAQNEDFKNLIAPEEIIEYAFENHQIVMMNEAHYGQKRNIRSREIGKAILPVAHAKGVRHIAIEALGTDTMFVKEANLTRKVPKVNYKYGYLMQPEMRNLIQTALDLGWTLIMYEANLKDKPSFDKNTTEGSNWREKEQAKNLAKALNKLEENSKLLIWCGNSHNSKEYGETPIGKLFPMGYQFWQLTGIEPFEIDQLVTIGINPHDNYDNNKKFQKWVHYIEELQKSKYGTLGFLDKKQNKASIISLYNKLE